MIKLWIICSVFLMKKVQESVENTFTICLIRLSLIDSIARFRCFFVAFEFYTLQPHNIIALLAGDEARTHDPHVGNVMLYH